MYNDSVETSGENTMSHPPYLLISDTHYHSFSQFSTVNDGINSRLQIALDATREAATALYKAGGNIIIHAGDAFHVRGRIEPSVLIPVMDLYRELVEAGFKVFAIPGNHDLEGNNSVRVSNAIAALEDVGVTVAHSPMEIQISLGWRVRLFPWFSTVAALTDAMKESFHWNRGKVITAEVREYDAIIHAPIDGVLPHLPSHGLNASALSGLGFKRVFSGHYHNHKDLGDGIYSAGALTHQTWGDVGSLAGFTLVYKNSIEHRVTSAPRFLELTGEEDAAALPDLVRGNLVRMRMSIKAGDEAEVAEMREQLLGMGAAGTYIIPIITATVTRASAPASGVTIESSIEAYVAKHKHSERVHKLALEVFNEARGAA